MTAQTLANRVDILEERVTHLEELPARVDALTLQVSQLRDEIHAEFSAVRGEIRSGDEETRRQMRVLHEDVVGRLTLIQKDPNRRSAPGAARRSRKR